MNHAALRAAREAPVRAAIRWPRRVSSWIPSRRSAPRGPLCIAIIAFMAIGAASSFPIRALADDVGGPTAEQVTERTGGVLAVWDALVEGARDMKVRMDESIVSTGEFSGARLVWTRSALSLEGALPLTESVRVGISPTFAWEHLEVVGNDEFISSSTGHLADFFDSGLRLGARVELNQRWGTEFVAGFSARHESGAHYFDSSQAGGSIALTYRRGRWLRLRLGLGLGSDLSDAQLRLSPVYRIQIKPAPGWTLESSGLGATVEWEATRKATLSLGGRVDGTQYRLNKRGDPPTGSGDATLQRRQARLEIGGFYRFHEWFRIRGSVGVVLEEEIEILDEDGLELVARRNRDPSAILRIGIDLRL